MTVPLGLIAQELVSEPVSSECFSRKFPSFNVTTITCGNPLESGGAGGGGAKCWPGVHRAPGPSPSRSTVLEPARRHVHLEQPLPSLLSGKTRLTGAVCAGAPAPREGGWALVGVRLQRERSACSGSRRKT